MRHRTLVELQVPSDPWRWIPLHRKSVWGVSLCGISLKWYTPLLSHLSWFQYVLFCHSEMKKGRPSHHSRSDTQTHPVLEQPHYRQFQLLKWNAADRFCVYSYSLFFINHCGFYCFSDGAWVADGKEVLRTFIHSRPFHPICLQTGKSVGWFNLASCSSVKF